MAKFKIFYSWQSDLPGSKTRSFIRECIDEAISFANESEAIEAARDEATKGLTGSPNIVTSIYSKIDECDMFVADVTLCFTGDVPKDDTVKRSPNPNVLLELGYAVKTLGWERVVCLANTDFGSDYPFDINQNRRFSFSLEKEDKKTVRHELTKLILSNIQTLQGQMPRAKAGFSSHLIGSYDFGQKKVSNEIVPLDFCNSESFRLHNEELLFDAKKLLTEIQVISKRMDSIKSEKGKSRNTISDSNISQNDQIPVQNTTANYLTKIAKVPEVPAVWKYIEEDKEIIKRCLNLDVGDSFFDLGDLNLSAPLFRFDCKTNNGSKDANDKYDKLMELVRILSQYELRKKYLNTFNGMKFIPLAIQNYSLTADTNIRVIIHVEKGEAVDPSEHLIVNDLEGMQGQLCSYDDVGEIPELFILEEDGIVHYNEKQFEPEVLRQRSPIITENGFGYSPMTAEDYETELELYIASTYGKGFYEFSIQSLRPNECCWLGQGLLLKPVDEMIALSYSIHSDHSTGELTGKLELKLNAVES